MDRRDFLKSMAIGAASALVCSCKTAVQNSSARNFPNIILCMSDDQGWKDTGYSGHPILKTPSLDDMARTGVRFERFYAAAPVCSPTRGSCLTGRHPSRYGIFGANSGHLPEHEITLAEALKQQGYKTGHFGKWHLGTLTKTEKDSNRGGEKHQEHYSPPWDNGFDVCFSTEAKVPTWDPMKNPEKNIQGASKKQKPGGPYGTAYWIGPDEKAIDNLEGDDSRVIMDRAIPFIRSVKKTGAPFFMVIWFHTPHAPVIAGPEFRNLYKDCNEGEQHYYGTITAMDQQMGRLREELRSLGLAENTMLWFCSDNGPEGKKIENRNCGTAGILRGRKRSLFEGGVRVPGLLEWPAKIKAPRTIHMPCCTSDYFPTIIESIGQKPLTAHPMDGLSLLPAIAGEMEARPSPICFESRKQVSMVDNRYKIISLDGGENYALYDLIADPGEKDNLAGEKPEILGAMKKQLTFWLESCKKSQALLSK